MMAFDSVERKGGKNMANATYEVQANDAEAMPRSEST